MQKTRKETEEIGNKDGKVFNKLMNNEVMQNWESNAKLDKEISRKTGKQGKRLFEMEFKTALRSTNLN